MVIGVLLPDSTTHPTISHDFVAGMKAAFKYQEATHIEYAFGYIGFGTDAEKLKEEANKLLLQYSADIIVAFADHPVVDVLFPLMASLKKLLLVVNSGAKYAESPEAPENVFFHTLENSFHSYLISGYAASQTKSATMATSYYDGGYSLCHAITTPFLKAGSSIEYNFAGGFKLEDFNTNGLVDFVLSSDVRAIFSVLSGNLVPEFLKQLNEQLPNEELHLYATPVMLEETIALDPSILSPAHQISGFAGWYANAPNSENQIFCTEIRDFSGRMANSISALGWDTSKIIASLLNLAEGKPGRLSAIQATVVPEIQGAKGNLILDKDTHHFRGDAFRFHYTVQTGVELQEQIAAIESESTWREMITQEITGITSGWRNTYLCS